MALMLLTACTSTISSAPSLREYSAEEQDAMYVRLSQLDKDDIILDWMNDYAVLRKMVRAAK